MEGGRNRDVCGFYSDIVSKPESLQNVTHLLLAENDCLRRELSLLKNEQKGLDDKVQEHQSSLIVLQSGISNLQNIYDSKLQTHLEYDSKIVTQQQQMFEATNQLYSNWALGLTIVLGLAGFLSIFLISSYKKREVCEVVDDVKAKINQQLDTDDALRSLVVNAFDDLRVKNILLQLADNIKIDIRREQEFDIQNAINEHMGTEQIDVFRSILAEEGNDER